MKTTTAYKRLPPDSGTPIYEKEVHLSGFRDIKIQSRVNAEKLISDFMKYCERDADQPAARMILGAWGEGKTEAFYRLIKPWASGNNHHAFLLTARSIANAYVHYKGIDTSEARLFLAAIFHVLSDENIAKFPDFTTGTFDFGKWIEICLDILECSKKKVFLFIDEVEQLIHEPPDLRLLMLGIKQILDGKYSGFMPGERFSGRFFIFFACTPEAYNRIATDPDVRQVFGGYGRRMDKINIEPISLKESVQFLYKLLKYTYNEKLPKLLPITSSGILTALATISKRNMGHMVSLITRLLSSMKQADDKLQIIGPEQLLKFTIGRTINIEGHDTKCFEDTLYQQIIKKIKGIGVKSDFFIKLFILLLFDQKAITTEDIRILFEDKIWKGMDKIWMKYLNEVIIELGFSPGLLSFQSIKNNLGYEILFENLKIFLDKDKKGKFRFGEKLYEKKDIEDLLLQWNINENGKLVEHILMPSNINTINALLGPLSHNVSKQLLQIFRDLSYEKKIFFQLPPDLLNHIFPPPCPPGLEFIRDASDKFNLWRRATVEYTQKLSQDLPKALVRLCNTAEKQWYFDYKDIKELEYKIISTSLLYERKEPHKEIKINAFIFARSHIEGKEINQILKYIEIFKFLPHIIIVLVNEPVEAEIIKKIENRLRKRICFISIHSTYAKQMLASFWHINAGGAIYEDFLNNAKEALLNRDLDLYSHFNSWLLTGKKAGFIVDTPVLSKGISYKGLVNALRFILNAQTYEKNLNEIFEWNRNVLRRIVPYGTKTGLIPETNNLESFEGFRSLVGDLRINGFIEIDSENKPLLKLTPCEKTIIEELSLCDIHKDNWNHHFLILSSSESIIEEVYVESLMQRGFVEQKGKGRSLKYRKVIKKKELVAKTLNIINNFKKSITNLTKEFCSFIVAKERDIQVIDIEDVLTIIDERLKSIKEENFANITHANAVFVIRFIKEAGEKIINSTKISIRKIQEICKVNKIKYQEYVNKKIPGLIDDLSTFIPFDINIESLKDITELNDIIKKINETPKLIEKPDEKNLLKKDSTIPIDDLKSQFWYNSLDDLEKYPHNYYLYIIQKLDDSFKRKLSSLEVMLSTISKQIESIKERRSKLYRQVISLKIDKSQIVTNKIHDILKTRLQPLSIESYDSSSAIDIDSITTLEKLVEIKFDDLKRLIISFEQSYELLEAINSIENEYLSNLKIIEDKLKDVKTKFNMSEQIDIFKNIKELFNEIIQKHKRLEDTVIHISPNGFNEIKKEIINLNEDIKEINIIINSDLWKPYLKKLKTINTRIRKQITVCKKVGIKLEDLQKEYKAIVELCDEERTLNNFLVESSSCANEFDKFEEINTMTTEIINKNLNKNEKIVFENIIRISDQLHSQEGIDIEYLKERLPSTVKEDTLLLIDSLWKKGMITIKLFI